MDVFPQNKATVAHRLFFSTFVFLFSFEKAVLAMIKCF